MSKKEIAKTDVVLEEEGRGVSTTTVEDLWDERIFKKLVKGRVTGFMEEVANDMDVQDEVHALS